MKPIISINCRIRHPEYFSVGDYSIVDDYCYFSTQVKIGKCSHVASGCSIAGGKDRAFVLGDYCSVSSGVKIWCTSDDFVNDIAIILPDGMGEIKGHLITGDVIINDLSVIGTNSVIMPDNNIPEGVAIGALSFVPRNFKFEAWAVYAGVPIKLIKYRNKDNILRQYRKISERLNDIDGL